jgi:hypothetical protein
MSISGTLLYEVHFELAPPVGVGPTPEGFRAIYAVTGGTLKGERINGKVLPAGGADWARIRPDGSIAIDVRCCAETDDGALIYITYYGRLNIPPEKQAAVLDMTASTRPDPSEYYFRIAPLFETASEKYAWLNGILAVGIGRVVQGGVVYSVYAVD